MAKKASFDYLKVKNQDETSKWGAKEVRDDHPELNTMRSIPKAKDASEPQFKNDQMAKRGTGDVPNNWLRGNGTRSGMFKLEQTQKTAQPPRTLRPLPMPKESKSR